MSFELQSKVCKGRIVLLRRIYIVLPIFIQRIKLCGKEDKYVNNDNNKDNNNSNNNSNNNNNKDKIATYQ